MNPQGLQLVQPDVHLVRISPICRALALYQQVVLAPPPHLQRLRSKPSAQLDERVRTRYFQLNPSVHHPGHYVLNRGHPRGTALADDRRVVGSELQQVAGDQYRPASADGDRASRRTHLRPSGSRPFTGSPNEDPPDRRPTPGPEAARLPRGSQAELVSLAPPSPGFEGSGLAFMRPTRDGTPT